MQACQVIRDSVSRIEQEKDSRRLRRSRPNGALSSELDAAANPARAARIQRESAEREVSSCHIRLKKWDCSAIISTAHRHHSMQIIKINFSIHCTFFLNLSLVTVMHSFNPASCAAAGEIRPCVDAMRYVRFPCIVWCTILESPVHALRMLILWLWVNMFARCSIAVTQTLSFIILLNFCIIQLPRWPTASSIVTTTAKNHTLPARCPHLRGSQQYRRNRAPTMVRPISAMRGKRKRGTTGTSNTDRSMSRDMTSCAIPMVCLHMHLM